MRRNMSINLGNGARPATSGGGGSQPQRLLAAPFFTTTCADITSLKSRLKYLKLFELPLGAK